MTAARQSAAAAVVLLLGALSTVPAVAQSRWSVAASAGIARPADNIAALVNSNVTYGLDVGYRLLPRVEIRADGQVAPYSHTHFDNGFKGPDITFRHYNVGVDVELTDPRSRALSLSVGGGPGIAVLDSDEFFDRIRSRSREFDRTYPTFHGRVEAGWSLGRHLGLFAETRLYVGLADQSESAVFEELSDARVHRFGTVLLNPVSFGLKWSL